MLRTLTFGFVLGLVQFGCREPSDPRKPYKSGQSDVESKPIPDGRPDPDDSKPGEEPEPQDPKPGEEPEPADLKTPTDQPNQSIENGNKTEPPTPIPTPSDRKDMGESPKKSPPSFCAKLEKSGDWASKKAFYGSNGKLNYPEDAQKNRVPDFSFAGYRYGEVEPPHYPVAATIKPIAGDNTAAIQKALDDLAKTTPNAQGIRGALLLSPGRYEVRGTLYVKADGMVLRGSGDGDNQATDTIIWGRGNVPHQRTIIILGSDSNSPFVATGAAEEISDEWVSVGSLSVNVGNASRFKVGDWVQIKHPSTANWLNAIDGGGVKVDDAWAVGSTDILYNRRIVKIQGRTLSLDAPIYNHLDRRLAVSTISALKSPIVVKESGIENLRIDIETLGGEDENHAWTAIAVSGAEDSWVRGITALHFGLSGVMTKHAIRITIDQARTSDPVGIRTGMRFYNFNASAMSQLILIKNCFAKDGRHNFISNGVQTASGIGKFQDRCRFGLS